MKKYIREIWKWILLFIPFVLGMIGYMVDNESFLTAAYKCFGLYGMGEKMSNPNIWLEFARWLAPLATASGVILIVRHLRRKVRGVIARLKGDSVAVFGPQAEREEMVKALGSRGIEMERRLVKANSYLLLASEEENLDFYKTHLQRLNKPVYMKCSNLPAQASNHAKLHLFNPEEIAARLFWKEYCPYPLSVQHNHKLRIVFLGFGKLGKELLLSGLQNNIFDANQCIEYHIFGEENGFSKIYHEIDQIADPVQFYGTSWHDHMDIIEKADIVIVAQQQNQLSILRDLTLVLPQKKIFVFSAQPDGTSLLADQANLVCFDWKTWSKNPDNIFCDQLDLYAKRINLRYAHLYDGVEETDEAREREWNNLTTFLRYSNISAADYHSVQLQMLGNQELTKKKLEWLAELEHNRWCRYHYLNNWTYATPDNGKNKDAQKRIHICLRPYKELPDSEQEKDRENIRILFALDSET